MLPPGHERVPMLETTHRGTSRGGDAERRVAADLQRAAGGDHAAFAQVYDATSARAFGVALRVLRDVAQAEEVVQEAYLQVWRFSTRFDPTRGGAVTWILIIVHSKAVDRVRAVERQARRDTIVHASDLRNRGDDDATFTAVHDRWEATRVRRALAVLTPAQRESIHLAYFDGRTHVEIADRLGLPVGTVKSRIRDGLRRLRDELAD